MMLIIFALMIAGSKNINETTLSYLKISLFTKMESKITSILWKFLFFFMKSIHTLALFLLFVLGAFEMNLYNLGLMFFFMIFTAFPACYRRCSVLLVIFASFFIWGEYFWTLVYSKVSKDSDLYTYC